MNPKELAEIARKIGHDAGDVQTLLNQIYSRAETDNEPKFRLEMLREGISKMANIIKQSGKILGFK